MTKKQREIIQLYIDNPKATDTKIAEMAGCTQGWLSQLNHRPEFKEELEKALREKWQSYTKMAMENMVNIANKGVGMTAFSANKYILDSAGYAAPQEIKLDGGLDISIDYGED